MIPLWTRTGYNAASEKAKWYNDPDEVVAFARWYWEGPDYGVRSSKNEIFDYFEKPWKYDSEYWEWKKETA